MEDPQEPRTEDDILAQARALLIDPDQVRWPDSTLRLLFSMSLTWCHMGRHSTYEEHDANRLLRRIVGDAKDMYGIVSPNLQHALPKPKKPHSAA
jgi:hypothetical protein